MLKDDQVLYWDEKEGAFKNEWNDGGDVEDVQQNFGCKKQYFIVFKKWANPGLFFCLFSGFSNKHRYNFYNK